MASAALRLCGPAHATACKETSPDSRCPICLDRFTNVSYADRCFHRFCFCCILEWGKNKAQCPLCKQPFSAVYHSVCSEHDFRIYRLPPVNNGSFGNVQGRRFRYRTTLTHWHRREERTQGDSHPQEVMHFRLWLYRHDVRVRCVRDNGRSRDTSADFFRKNPACLHRLVPWLKRELAVLCGSHDSRNDVALHAILSLITRYDMQDESFLQKLRPFLSTRTEHFLHEFLSFAKSPFNMEAYDRHAVYDCPAPSRLSPFSEDDADLRSAPSPWDDETPGPSYSSATQHVYTITVSDSDVDSASEEEEEETVSVHANTNVNDNYARVDEDESSSNEDCVIISVIKPTTQRTPELVQLSSDSEVSVKEEPEPATSNQSELRDQTNQRCRNKDHSFLHSDTKQNSVRSCRNWERSEEKNWERSRERNWEWSRERNWECSRERRRERKSQERRRRERRSGERSRERRREGRRERRSKERSGERRSRESLRRRSRSLRDKGRSNATNHSSLSQHRHSKHADTRPSRTHSRSKTHSHSRFRRLFSQSKTRSRLGSRTRSRSYSGSWRMQASAEDRKCSESLSLNPSSSSNRRSSCDPHHGEQKHESLHGEKRRSGKEKQHHHHHHHSKKKKKRRRRSSSIDIRTERKKRHKKKKHKTAMRSRGEQTGLSPEATSPLLITIHTDAEATPPTGAAPTDTEELTACSR